jgi:hypothetical protein
MAALARPDKVYPLGNVPAGRSFYGFVMFEDRMPIGIPCKTGALNRSTVVELSRSKRAGGDLNDISGISSAESPANSTFRASMGTPCRNSGTLRKCAPRV